MKQTYLLLFIFCLLLALSGCAIIQDTATDEEMQNIIAEKSTAVFKDDTTSCTTNNDEVNINRETQSAAKDCLHKETDVYTVQEATCEKQGKEETKCNICKKVIATKSIPALQHTFVSNSIQASCSKEGTTYEQCLLCNKKRNEKTIPKTQHKYTEKTDAPTCSKEGRRYKQCTQCNDCIVIEVMEKQECEWGWVLIKQVTCEEDGMLAKNCKWCRRNFDYTVVPTSGHHLVKKTLVFPTPEKDGLVSQSCINTGCKFTEEKTIKFEPLGNYHLCIPKININVAVHLGECNQENTDEYDVSCDLNFINQNNPLFFGHSNRSLGDIYKLKIGDIIYIVNNGATAKYKVTISEEARLNDNGTNMTGIKTGTVLLEKRQKETLHFFTCYYSINSPNGRWMVFAEKIE